MNRQGRNGSSMRWKLTIAYDGTRYQGWQMQQGRRTIQGALMDAARQALGERARIQIQGSGRTDAGVHAIAQVAHLEAETRLSPQQLQRAINDGLPYDITVMSVEKVASSFHARHDAVARSYVYVISRQRTAFMKPFVWWVKDSLDVEAMRQAADCLVGRHDFAAFTDPDAESPNTIVDLSAVDIYDSPERILIHITGSHFLWKMVRRVVGVLVDTGRGNRTPSDVEALLNSTTGDVARLTAPPSGLFLEHVYYRGERPERGVHVAERAIALP